LAGYSVGKGSRGWRELVEEHLAGCTSCRAELAALEAVDGLVEKATTHHAPDLWEAIEPRLEPRRSPWFASIFSARRRVYAAAMTAAAATVAVALFWQKPVLQPAPQTNTVRLQRADSHVTMTWSDPFADRASLAILDSEIGEKDRL
jgi:anti-sigma factor RsiW